MNWIGSNIAVSLGAASLIAFVLAGTALAQTGIVELVPTARQAPATWRYILDAPANNDWTAPAFDDSGWRSGRSAFGTPGTPGVPPNARGGSRDIWLRREVTLPAKLDNLAAL